MDQAKTLRKLLGKRQAVVTPILGDLGRNYAACLGRFILEQRAHNHETGLLFDGSMRGLNELAQTGMTQDLIYFLQGKTALEDLVIELGKSQHLICASEGLKWLGANPRNATQLLEKLHRLPVSCDHLYATLAYSQIQLAHALCSQGEWLWLVQPTAQSVTRVFQGISSSRGVSEFVQHRVIVVGVKSVSEADHVFANLEETTSRFLSRPLQYAGHLPLLELNAPLSQVKKDMVVAGRRIAKAICSVEEHAYA